MKFKMAPNSLFAVLLRSQWWISMAVAVAFLALSRALLPPQYMFFGALGGIPFLVIAGIRAFRQWNAPREADVQKILDAASGMNVREFTDALSTAFTRKGYTSQHVERDVAVDLLLTKAGQTTLVACKRRKASNHGVEPLRALVQARQDRDATHCVYVLLSDSNARTSKFATDNQVEMLSGTALVQLLGKDMLRTGA